PYHPLAGTKAQLGRGRGGGKCQLDAALVSRPLHRAPPRDIWAEAAHCPFRLALDRGPRRVECCFVARHDAAVAALLKGTPETADWNHEVSRIDDPARTISVKIISPPVYLSREALLELVDVMMIAAHDSGCVFDRFHDDLSDLQQRRRWKFW